MGIFMDILEDGAESWGQLIDEIESKIPKKSFPKSDQPSPSFMECPLCGEKLISKKDFDQHIIRRHANRHVYIRAGHKIIRNFYLFTESPETLKVILVGIDEAKIIIEQAALPPKELNFFKEIDLLPQFKEDLSGEVRLKVEFSGGSHEFTIYIGKMIDFNWEDIDKAALKYLFVPLDRNKEPDLTGFSGFFLTPSTGTMEYYYASGLYDYALGFHMKKAELDAKEHFENALGLLSPFKTSFAITACRVLAVRMNCFKLLQDCTVFSRFTVANLFFNKPEARFVSKSESIKLGWSPQEYGVYIDEFTETLLAALNAYYSEDYNILDELCRQLDSVLATQDKNNRDKLLLLQARIAKKKNNEKVARDFYQMLRYHPDFKDEAREYLQ
jgi:uncharacterized C2H2 Zn-finger protein